jgi:site-specific DNA-methyltransferase (adenine-specific)|tara:strand:+ start:5 stop:730 length:726 start_codon:yes stop_codon:yes gene_type:complete
LIQLINDDCLKVLPTIPNGSIDLILTDPPYGTTACRWDSIIPFDPMWKELKRIIKDNGCIALFGSEPFSSSLRISNIKWFRYDWVWEKTRPTGFFLAKKQPLKIHENISIFYKKQCFYNPIKKKADEKKIDKRKTFNPTSNPYLGGIIKNRTKDDGTRFPLSIQKFPSISQKGQHPTQKPVALLEYLIKTYTNKNDTVLDFTMGSGTTGVASKNLNRNFIGIEKDQKYFEVVKQRIEGTLI